MEALLEKTETAPDFLRETLAYMLQQLMEWSMRLEGLCGAGRHATGERMGCRDDVRTPKSLQTPSNRRRAVPTPNASKSQRIDVRTSGAVKELLQEAARSCHKNVSEFLLDAGIAAANQALADRRHFELNEGRWAEFQQALDRPVKEMPRLTKLLSEPGVLD